jgi:hypothetical protein
MSSLEEVFLYERKPSAHSAFVNEEWNAHFQLKMLLRKRILIDGASKSSEMTKEGIKKCRCSLERYESFFGLCMKNNKVWHAMKLSCALLSEALDVLKARNLGCTKK